MKFRFKDFNVYPHQLFEIDHYHPADPTHARAWLKCITDPDVEIGRYVNMSEITLA